MDHLCAGLFALLLVSPCYVAGAPEQGVAVKWGVADGTASVGRLFRMHIPSDAFIGEITSLQVQTADGSSLPSWLQFDATNNVLQGISSPKDAGQLFLEIIAKGRGSQASTSFTLFIRDVASHTLGGPLRFKPSVGPEFVHCKQSEPETVATIIIDTELDSLTVAQRVSLLQKFTSHMQLHEDMVKMIPVGTAPLHDSSALVSGTGDATSPKTQGSFISWAVGCGQVKDGHFPVLHRLDEDSSSGKISKVLGFSVIGWHVTNSHMLAPSRKRRQVHGTPTPVMTPVLPTKTDKTGGKTDDPADRLTHAIIDKETPILIQPTAMQTEMPKTAMPTPTDQKPVKPVKPHKVSPSETTVKIPPMEKTASIKPTMTVKDGEPTYIPKPAACIPGSQIVPVNDTITFALHDGTMFTHQLDDNLFKDCDKIKRPLSLTLLKGNEKLEADDFVQFDTKKLRISAFPLRKLGNHTFMLSANKSVNSNQFPVIKVVFSVTAKSMSTMNHKLSAIFDYNYAQLMSSTTEKINLIHRLASAYGKPMEAFHFHDISQGSVNLTWSFLPTKSNCQLKDIKMLVDNLILDNGSLNLTTVDYMKPYKLIGAESVMLGPCSKHNRTLNRSAKPVIPTDEDNIIDKDDPKKEVKKVDNKHNDPDGDDDDDDDEAEGTTELFDKDDKMPPATTTLDVKTDVAKGSKGGDDDDVWITTVVPAVVIIVILLIALLVACCLYRKKRKGKMNVEEQNTFINKGAPVIFPDELEDKPSDVNKPLLVEGSPAPPDYRRGASESPERNFRSNGNNKAMSQNDEGIIEMPEKPYNPPAPPVGGSVNSRQPRPSQQPFSQPPQILP